MSSLKFITVRRRSAGARGGRGPPGAAGCASSAAQLPVALKTASGVLRLSLFSRHSRTPPSRATAPGPRLTASISRWPSFLPRRSKSSTTMSSAGRLSGCSSSRFSTSLAAAAATGKAGQPGIQPAAAGARRLPVLDKAVELGGIDVGAPEQSVARAADHHVVQGPARPRSVRGHEPPARWAGSPPTHWRARHAPRGAPPAAPPAPPAARLNTSSQASTLTPVRLMLAITPCSGSCADSPGARPTAMLPRMTRGSAPDTSRT